MLEKIRSYYCQRTFNLIEQIIIVCYDKDFMEVGMINKTSGKAGEVTINLVQAFKRIKKFTGAKYIVVSHNHPQATCYPSEDDITSTKIIKKHCANNEIVLFDDVIFDVRNHFSFKENGLL